MIKSTPVFFGQILQSPMALCVILAVMGLCSGCLFSGTTTPPPELTNPEWRLISYRSQEGAQIPILPGSSVTLKFSPDGRFRGTAGCNGYGGSYMVEGELITFDSLASTEMYCLTPPGVMQQEAEYLQLFSNITRYHVADEYLVLSYYDVEKMLIFTRN